MLKLHKWPNKGTKVEYPYRDPEEPKDFHIVPPEDPRDAGQRFEDALGLYRTIANLPDPRELERFLDTFGNGYQIGENRNLKTQISIMLTKEQYSALGSLGLWLCMTEAERSLIGEPALTDDMVALNFMGSGASHMVTVGDIRKILELREYLRVQPDSDEITPRVDEAVNSLNIRDASLHTAQAELYELAVKLEQELNATTREANRVNYHQTLRIHKLRTGILEILMNLHGEGIEFALEQLLNEDAALIPPTE